MATLPYALATLDQVKRRLKISNTSDDDTLEELIDEMTVFIEGECDRRFFDDTAVTEIYDGDYDFTLRNKLFTKRWPINSVTSVATSSGNLVTPTWTILDPGTQYVVDGESGEIHFNLPPGFKSVRVIYRGGYTTIPQDLRLACIKLVAKAFLYSKSEGVKNESVGGASVGWNVEIDKVTEAILNRYKRYAF